MKLEEIKLNDDELLVILGGNDDHEQTTYNCGLGCGNGWKSHTNLTHPVKVF